MVNFLGNSIIAPEDHNCTAYAARLEGVSKTYSGPGQPTATALRDVNLQFLQGEFVAVMGASGSGKSTLLHLLGALDRATTGACYGGNTNLTTMNNAQRTAWRQRNVGFVFQSFNLLWRLSALENVMLALMNSSHTRIERQNLAMQALVQVGLADRALHRPSELSGGQQQRVAIARAIVKRPMLILADEPTGALDSETGQIIMQLFSKIHNQNSTVVIVTHDSDVARWAERKIFFKDGQVVSDERPLSAGNAICRPTSQNLSVH
jgi:putative ABC transport system ATP-binding protein